MPYNQHANRLGKAAEKMNITFSGSRGAGGVGLTFPTPRKTAKPTALATARLTKLEYLKTRAALAREVLPDSMKCGHRDLR